jgi:tRNA(fMet)-specific endonuclease VapC
MRGDADVVERLLRLPKSDVLVPQPVLAEIAYGLARMRRSARKRRLEKRWKVYLEELGRAVWTDDVSDAFGRIKATLERRGIPLEDFDVAIAAHARALDAVLVSDDARHMARIPGLKTESWRS